MLRAFCLFILILILSCAPATKKVSIHEIVGKDTLRLKVILFEREDTDRIYQEKAVRETEASLTKIPVSYTIRSKLTGKEVDLVIVTRREVEKVKKVDAEVVKSIGKRSNVDVIVVTELIDTDFKEKEWREENRECISREAEVIISYKVFETEEGKIILAGIYEGEERFKKCEKGKIDKENIPSKDVLIVKAIKEASDKFSKEFWANL